MEAYLFVISLLHKQIEQPDLGMSHPEMYLLGRNTPEAQAYERYAIETAVHLGAVRTTAVADMRNVVDFETELAKVSLSDFFYKYVVFFNFKYILFTTNKENGLEFFF